MHIDHIAIWTADLERLAGFYVTYFGAKAGAKYNNPARQFESYFLNFSSGARLELMREPEMSTHPTNSSHHQIGYAHISIAMGSETIVNELTQRLKQAGYRMIDGPRRTGDGYYESVVLDPDGNQVEITV